MNYHEAVERVPFALINDKKQFQQWLKSQDVMFWTLISEDFTARTAVIRVFRRHLPGTAPTEDG